MNTTASLTVILVTGHIRKLSARSLQTLLEQDIIKQMEILIIDCVPQDIPPLPGSEHPSVRVIQKPEDFQFEAAMVLGIREATAPIVALLEEHCVVLPGWGKALVEAHKEPWGAVCGEVINGNPGLGWSNAEFFATRNIRWQSPARRAQISMIDGHNSAYKRDILLSYGDQLESMLRAEAVLLFKMQEDGHKLLLEPAAKYIHVNEAGSTFPSSLFYWHRIFGHTRASIFNWTAAQRLKRLFMLLLLPWWHSANTFIYILRYRRNQIWLFTKNLPAIMAFNYISSAGQAMGILFGEGQAAHQFSDRERGTERIPRMDLIKWD